MLLDTRLEILKNAGQISEKNFDAMLKVISMFESKWGIKLTEENGALFITHLSVAFERIVKGEWINGLDEEVFSEIKENENYSKFKEAFDDVKNEIGLKIPENEGTFILVHICSLFEC